MDPRQPNVQFKGPVHPPVASFTQGPPPLVLPSQKPPQLSIPNQRPNPPLLVPPSNGSFTQNSRSSPGQSYSFQFQDDEPLDIPTGNTSMLSMLDTLRNVENEGKMMKQCRLDLFSLRFFYPLPEPADPSLLTYDRPLISLAVGYFIQAKGQNLPTLKQIRDKVINTDFKWTTETDITVECPDVKSDPRNINKVYLQFHDMLVSKTIDTILREYGTVDKIIQAVLISLLKTGSLLNRYKSSPPTNTAQLANIFKEFEGVLGIKVLDTGISVKVIVENLFFNVKINAGKFEVKLAGGDDLKSSNGSGRGAQQKGGHIKYSAGKITELELSKTPVQGAQIKRVGP